MALRARAADVSVDVSLVINAHPDLVVRAFFDPQALGAWWRVVRSVTTPRTLGAFAVEWATSEDSDDVLGRLGGVLRGTVMQFDPAGGFFVADLYWLPPDGAPIGPMALDVTWTTSQPLNADPAFPCETATHLRIRQTGFEDTPRWRRYYEITTAGWERSLRTMKGLLER